MGSRSARALRDELGGLNVYPDRTYRPRPTDLIINWGNSSAPNWMPQVSGPMLNRPEAVGVASNKLRALRVLEEAGVPIPNYTTDMAIACRWDKIVVRHKLTGHGGDGIEVVNGGIVPHAPLYTRLVSPKAEYRVHVFNGRVIDYIKKRRAIDDEPTQEQNDIRSHENGWIFTRENLRRLDRIEQMAIDAVSALGLDFGGVDIIRDQNNDCFVLEVNTAVGMEGTTLERYVESINNYGRNTTN